MSRIVDPLPQASAGAWRFMLAWSLPIAIALAALQSAWWAWVVGIGFQIVMTLLERWPANRHSPPAVPAGALHALVPRLHLPLQFGLLGLGLVLAAPLHRSAGDWAAVFALGIAVGIVTGSQGITFAHELGHSRRRLDRLMGWLLMSSVNYSHFMVEHYRGHHSRVGTPDDPASARRGESLWRFLPRTLAGSWRSAWRLEARQLRQLRRPWARSPLLWATLAQVVWLSAIAAIWGGSALLFWLVQSAYAVFLLETINYIEHYGLQRRQVDGRTEPFGVGHAWNADHHLTNLFIINLQRHSDHHMHAWKAYPELAALPGPQLPTGYTGCLMLASVPPLWFRTMHPRLDRLQQIR